jgi:hypothetical protein
MQSLHQNLYSVLRDRQDLSIKNNWVDADGHIYLIFTNDELMQLLSISKPTVVKYKKELENANLIINKQIGLNKANRLYVLKPEMPILDRKGSKENELPLKSTEVKKMNSQKSKNFTSRSKENELQEVKKVNSNDTDFSDTDFNDTNFSDTDYSSSSIDNNKPVHSNNSQRTFDDDELNKLLANHICLAELYDYLLDKGSSEELTKEIMIECLKRDLTEFRILQAVKQLEWMIEKQHKGEIINNFAVYFANGLKAKMDQERLGEGFSNKRKRTAGTVHHLGTIPLFNWLEN